MPRLGLAVLVAAVIAGCGSHEVSPGTSETVLRPAHPDGRLVIVVHGAGFTARTALADPPLTPVVTALLGRGFTVAASDSAGENWGNAAGVQAQADLYRHVRASHPISEVDVLSVSMGGLAGLQSLSQLPAVHAWVGIYPVCDVRSVYDLGRYSREITRALGHAPPAGPVRFTVRAGMPMTFIASAQDTVVPASRNSAECAAEGREQGASVRVVSATGEHGDPSHYQVGEIVRAFTT